MKSTFYTGEPFAFGDFIHSGGVNKAKLTVVQENFFNLPIFHPSQTVCISHQVYKVSKSFVVLEPDEVHVHYLLRQFGDNKL